MLLLPDTTRDRRLASSEGHLHADPLVLDPTISEGRTLHLTSYGGYAAADFRERGWCLVDRNTEIIA